ncbi:hypothetical protein N7488_001307 [Penicillium malachiteum]|nr:hypothetical protein N7488_001307 [Penicillium malachiteum]
MSSAKVAVLTPDAPAPNNLMSHLGLDTKTGTFVPGDASDRTVQALRNLEAILKAAGSDLSKAVKINIFISSLDHYAKVN